MATNKGNPAAQKAKLVAQLKAAQENLAAFDKNRAVKIGNLAKKYRLTDLTDDILESEFKAIRDKHKAENDPTLAARDTTAKKL